MIKMKIIFSFAFVHGLIFSLVNHPREFITIKPKLMLPILNNLHSYSVAQFSKTKCSTKEMFISYCRNLREAKYFLKQQIDMESTICLGWIPLMNDERMIHFRDYYKPFRNDNSGVPYRQVPYIFIIFNNELQTLKIEKILINPTIDLEINMNYLKTDLECVCTLSHLDLDTSMLSSFDEGRWHLIFSESQIL